MARYKPEDHGPPDSMGGLHGAAEAVRSAGRGGDTVLAHINPREAALLKAHGGSGTINPKTGLLEFDDDGGYYYDPGPSYYYDPGPSYSYSYDPTPSTDYYSSNLGAMTGGYDPISYGTDTLAQMQGYNDLWNSGNYGLNDIVSPITSTVNDFYNSLADSLNSNINSITSSLPSVSQVIDYITPDYSQYVDPTKLVQQPDFVKQPAFGSDQPNVGATVQSDADRAAMTGVGQDLTTPTGTIYYTVPSPTGGATLGVGANEVVEGLAGLAGQYGTIPGANAVTTDTPPTSDQPTVLPPDLAQIKMDAINRLLNYSDGTLIGKNEITPSDLAKQTETINNLLDYSGGTVIGKSDAAPPATTPSDDEPADLTTKYVQTIPITPENDLQQESAQLPNVTLDFAQPKTGVQIGGSENLQGQFTVGGVEGYSGGTIDPYGDYTPVGPDQAPSASDLTIAGPSSTGGTAADLGPLIYVPTLDTINVPQTAKGTGSLDPNLFTTVSTPDITARTLAEQSSALTTLNQQLNNQMAAQPSTAAVTPSIDPLTGAVDTTPVTTTATISPPMTPRPPPTLRTYLGSATDPYSYGFGAERQYYGAVPTAARGGYFNADQYFADGGLVQPLSPPTTPLVSAQPTMAFTDGAGAVGSIAQPPGLAPSDSYGSDAPHASPMAPSVAAAVPTMQPGLATLAVPNVNASPVTSQVSQNPNVGYALGNSPLSNLTRS
jgi:hypothetical protein